MSLGPFNATVLTIPPFPRARRPPSFDRFSRACAGRCTPGRRMVLETRHSRGLWHSSGARLSPAEGYVLCTGTPRSPEAVSTARAAKPLASSLLCPAAQI